MKNTFQLMKEFMDMPEATRGISMNMLREQFNNRTINKCIDKEYIELRSWFGGEFDTNDKNEHLYRERSGGIYIPTNKIVKTYVYSDEYGKDIVARFKPNKVSNIKRIDEPLDNTVL